MRIACVVALLLASVGSAEAGPAELEKDFETDKTVGVGLMLGVPAGLSAKFFLVDQLAIDLGIGGQLGYRDRDGFAIHADVLWHPFVAVEGRSFLAPLVLGVGARFLDYDQTSRIGVRVPVGLSFDFTDLPIDVFGELALVVDVAVDNGDDTSPIDANFVVGARYFL